MTNQPRPLPRVTPLYEPYHRYARQHELRLQRCQGCGHVRYPFATLCPLCHSEGTEWARVSGRGAVASFAICHQAFHPWFQDRLPYNVALVELEEGPRLPTNIVGVRNEDIRIGMEVEAEFEDVTEEVTLVQFRPKKGRASAGDDRPRAGR